MLHGFSIILPPVQREQTTLQALHVVVHNIKGLQQLLTDRIQSAAAGWQSQTRFLSSHDAP